MSTGAFNKIAGAAMTGGGNPIKDGIYKFCIEKVFIQDGHSGQLFIAELRVLEAQANGATDEQNRPVAPNGVGSQCSLVCNLTKHDAAAGNAKKFIYNAFKGLDPSTEEKDMTPELMGKVCGEQNPLNGVVITDETYRGVNKGRTNAANAGKPLTLNGWKPIEQTTEDVLKMRAYLEANKPAVTATPATTSAQLTQTTTTSPTQSTTPAKSGGALGALLGVK